MAGENQTVFEFTAKDDVTPVLQGMMKAIGQLNTTVTTDKGMQSFEKSMANAGQKAGLLTTAVRDQSKALSSATPAQQAYLKNLRTISELSSKKTGTTTTLPGGQVTGAGGFLSKEDIGRLREAESATKALAQSQVLMAETSKSLQLKGLSADLTAMQNAMSPAGQAAARAAANVAMLSEKLQNVPPPALRYALYDVSNTLAIMGAAMVAGGVAAFKFSASFEDAFADVRRTVDEDGLRGGFDGLKDSLIDLSQTMPVAFEELAKVASLGGQMGISSKGIEQFTASVSKMSAITDLSLDAAATAFGRFKALLNLDESDFEALGSSILKVGINSVATEGQIVRISTQIASMAGFAGFTADQVVGLSGALASIGVAPELSRGIITRLFNNMSKAVSTSGSELEKLAQVSGTSADQFKSSWGTGEFADTFLGFVDGIRKEGGQAVATLVELGIAGVRDIPVLLRLAGAADSAGKAGGLLAQTFDDAKSGWEEATELSKQYATRMDTVTKRAQIFGNTVASVFAGLGDAALGPASGMLDMLTGIARGIENLVDTPVIGYLMSLGLGFTTVMGALLLLSAAVTRGYAGILGMQQAMGGLLGATNLVKPAIVNAIAAFAAAEGAAAKTSIALRGMGSAMYAALGPVGIAILAFTAFTAILPAMQDGFRDLVGRATDVKSAMQRLGSDTSADLFKGNLQSLDEYISSRPKWDTDTQRNIENLIGGFTTDTVISDIKAVDDAIAGFIESGNLRAAGFLMKQFTDANQGIGRGDIASTLSETSSKMGEYELVLSKGADGAWEFANASDSMAQVLQDTEEATEAASQKLVEYTDALASGSMAFVKTGDLIKKQQEERTKLAKESAIAEADGAEVADDAWTKFYDGQEINLDMYLASQAAAIAKQDEWEAGMQKLANMGVSDAFLTDLARLGPESLPLVQALITGTDEQLEIAKQQFADAGMGAAMGFAVALAVNTDIAVNAAKTLGSGAGSGTVEDFLKEVEEGRIPFVDILKKYSLDAAGNPIAVDANTDLAAGTVNRWITDTNGRRAYVSVVADISYNRSAPPSWAIDPNPEDFAYGGYTGNGGKFEPAGTVHKGEFVMTKEATSRIGVANLYNMMRGGKNATAAPASRSGYAGGGLVGGGGMGVMQLSPYDRALLRRLQPVVNVGSDRVSAAANKGNRDNSSRGTQ